MKTAAKLLAILALLSVLSVSQVSVKGYTRKDGTVVSSYTRRESSRTGGDTKLYNPRGDTIIDPPPPKPNRKAQKQDARNCILVDPGFIVCGGQLVSQYATQTAAIPRDSRGRILRSGSAKKTFQSLKPCPANNSTDGRCPGYVIDHVMPLVCGGADDPSNMQWQTVAEGKAKDKWERSLCGK